MSRADRWSDAELDVLRRAHAEGITADAVVAWAQARLPSRAPLPPRAPRSITFQFNNTRPGARVRGRCISKRISKRALAAGAQGDGAPLTPAEQALRPRDSDECRLGSPKAARPCPWVSCKHHLYLDVNERTGSVKVNFPDLEPWQLPHTCALDVAERGGVSLEELGVLMNLTRERARQLETKALSALVARLSEHHDAAAIVAALRDVSDVDASALETYRRATAPRRYLPVVRSEPVAVATTPAQRRAPIPEALSPRTWQRRAR